MGHGHFIGLIKLHLHLLHFSSTPILPLQTFQQSIQPPGVVGVQTEGLPADHFCLCWAFCPLQDKAEGRRQKAEGRRQKAEGRRQLLDVPVLTAQVIAIDAHNQTPSSQIIEWRSQSNSWQVKEVGEVGQRSELGTGCRNAGISFADALCCRAVPYLKDELNMDGTGLEVATRGTKKQSQQGLDCGRGRPLAAARLVSLVIMLLLIATQD
ncbi:MAG: hypothetical protein FRX49_09620 [Trebouxia sp. A1-2]|nr:MAG: hypothetical protein FRX49_09620 [Trebouxia sp. A1-2]